MYWQTSQLWYIQYRAWRVITAIEFNETSPYPLVRMIMETNLSKVEFEIGDVQLQSYLVGKNTKIMFSVGIQKYVISAILSYVPYICLE